MTHSLVSFGQHSDSLLISKQEARNALKAKIELSECREMLLDCDVESLVCDSLRKSAANLVASVRAESVIKDKVIDMHLHDKAVLNEKIRLQKRRNAATVGIASVVTLLSLFIAIK